MWGCDAVTERNLTFHLPLSSTWQNISEYIKRTTACYTIYKGSRIQLWINKPFAKVSIENHQKKIFIVETIRNHSLPMYNPPNPQKEHITEFQHIRNRWNDAASEKWKNWLKDQPKFVFFLVVSWSSSVFPMEKTQTYAIIFLRRSQPTPLPFARSPVRRTQAWVQSSPGRASPLAPSRCWSRRAMLKANCWGGVNCFFWSGATPEILWKRFELSDFNDGLGCYFPCWFLGLLIIYIYIYHYISINHRSWWLGHPVENRPFGRQLEWPQ